MKTAARMATYRSYRDEISKNFMAGIGVDVSNDPVYPDLAFRLPDPEPGKRPKGNTLIIGLGVMTYSGWSGVSDESVYMTYMGNISSFAVWLLKQGYQLRLLIGEPSDQRAIADLIKAVSVELGDIPEESILVDAPNSLHDLMNQMAGVDAVVATRFHNVLCSLKVGKPTISLGYAKKNDVLMESMGLGEFCQHIERLDVGVLKHQFDKLLEQRSIYQTIVQSKKAGLQDKLHQQEMFLVNHVI
jgi:polysaccharide pyruvyl transferase WcaK-like protein